MKNNNKEWERRRRRYWINNNFVCGLFMRLYEKLEGLIWLGICVGICVIVFKFVFFLGF
jgi:hypothetical protein